LQLCMLLACSRHPLANPQPKAAQINWDWPKQRVGLCDRTQQRPASTGRFATQQRDRATLAAGAVDFPAQHAVFLSDRDQRARIGADQVGMQLALERGIVGHCTAQRRKIARVQRVSRALSHPAQSSHPRRCTALMLKLGDHLLVYRRRVVRFPQKDQCKPPFQLPPHRVGYANLRNAGMWILEHLDVAKTIPHSQSLCIGTKRAFGYSWLD
jgi:hypothetical protein